MSQSRRDFIKTSALAAGAAGTLAACGNTRPETRVAAGETAGNDGDGQPITVAG